MTSRRGQQCPKHVTFVSHEQALAHLGRRVLCGRLGKCRMRSDIVVRCLGWTGVLAVDGLRHQAAQHRQLFLHGLLR